MKIAALVSGHLRTFIDNYPSWEEHFLSKYDCDVYVDLWDGYGGGGHNLQYTPIEDRIDSQDIGKIWELYKPTNLYIENFKNISPYFLSREKKWINQAPPYISNICGMWYKIYNGLKKIPVEKYDATVRLRPDHLFTGDLVLTKPESNTIYCDNSYSWDNETASDQFFYGDYSSMQKTCTFFEHFDEIYTEEVHPNAPEYTFFKYIKSLDITVDLSPYRVFKINRVKGHEHR
jgi:hypothetical protein